MRPNLRIGSVYEVEHWGKCKFRSEAYYLLEESADHNVVPDAALNKLLDIMFHGESAISPWYILLFNDDVTPGAGATYATPGFTESTNYSESTRVEFNEAAASEESISNGANKASFTMSASETIYGAALVSHSTKGDTSTSGAVLFGAARFGSPKGVASDEVLKVTVTISASST